MYLTNEGFKMPSYQKPMVFGMKESEVTPMAANRYMGFTNCCVCSGHSGGWLK